MTRQHKPGLRRFYKAVTTQKTEDGTAVLLDGKTPQTPARNKLVLPNNALAEAIAAEWDAQGASVAVEAMPLTRLANVAIDRTPGSREVMIDEAVKYAGTDLVSYPDRENAELYALQDAAWRPVREWAGSHHNVVLLTSDDLTVIPQPPVSLEAYRQWAGTLDDWRLTGLSFGLSLTGSALLAMAMVEGRLDADAAYRAAHVDEHFQMDRWGVDEEAARRLKGLQRDIGALGVWFAALG